MDVARNWPVNHLFEQVFGESPRSSMLEGTESRKPAVDVLEKDGNLILRAEVPGMEQKDIDLKLEGNVLTIKGERKFDGEEQRDNYHRIESFYGSFSRSFTLPETVDRDRISADYKSGILTITIPQKPEVKARAIPVGSK
jgi:HSP20 family protein